MYIDWVITLSLIIVVSTCVLFGYGTYFAIKKIQRDEFEHKDDVNINPLDA